MPVKEKRHEKKTFGSGRTRRSAEIFGLDVVVPGETKVPLHVRAAAGDVSQCRQMLTKHKFCTQVCAVPDGRECREICPSGEHLLISDENAVDIAMITRESGKKWALKPLNGRSRQECYDLTVACCQEMLKKRALPSSLYRLANQFLRQARSASTAASQR